MDTLTFAAIVILALVLLAIIIQYGRRGKINGRMKIGPLDSSVSAGVPEETRPELDQAATEGGEIYRSPPTLSAASAGKLTQASKGQGSKIDESGPSIV